MSGHYYSINNSVTIDQLLAHVLVDNVAITVGQKFVICGDFPSRGIEW